jgi:hypothetical protein
LRKAQWGTNRRLLHSLANVLRQFDRRSAPLRRPAIWPKECPMDFKDYDFTRNPVVQNEVFFLQSKCTACGFSILVRSVEELVEHEKLHRTQCSALDVAA